ncbi:uncharacterized protein LOC110768651 [Prunus avium]|uniref:Uncharacterized protein LOC110768651 n=1 Tax=Prunus avium TaxID=42229 RepID=A0A6P5TM75_PRUAV|nr:uncharacterized protein LOC110768651 [Prunus avium]
MASCSEEMDKAIAKLHQNFQDLRYHLEKAFLEQGRALLKFEAQWNDLKKEHKKGLEQHEVNLQQMGISVPSIGTGHFATANPNAALWSNTTAWASGNGTPTAWASGNGTPTSRASGNGTPKLHCDICNVYCDTKEVLDKHKLGKKHKMNMDKLKGKKPIPGQTSKRKAAYQPVEDLETKRRKVLESGAAPHTLRTCAICNVVCLSETDFNNHRAGQRHADAVVAMVKKHAAGTSSHHQPERRFYGGNQ